MARKYVEHRNISSHSHHLPETSKGPRLTPLLDPEFEHIYFHWALVKGGTGRWTATNMVLHIRRVLTGAIPDDILIQSFRAA